MSINGQYTPNEGILIDFETGLEYRFKRPAVEGGTTPKRWKVKEHDLVAFVISGNVATNVTLLRDTKRERSAADFLR
jgi:hypothetical protein